MRMRVNAMVNQQTRLRNITYATRLARDSAVGSVRRSTVTVRAAPTSSMARTSSTTSSIDSPLVSTTTNLRRLGQRTVAARRILAVTLDDRRLDVGDVAADLGDAPFRTDAWRRRDVQLQRGVGEDDRTDVAPFDDAPRARRPSPLPTDEFGADRAVGGDGV